MLKFIFIALSFLSFTLHAQEDPNKNQDRPGYEYFKQRFEVVHGKQSNKFLVQYTYDQLATQLRELTPFLKEFEALQFAINAGQLKQPLLDILLAGAIGVGPAMGLDFGLGVHKNFLTYRPHFTGSVSHETNSGLVFLHFLFRTSSDTSSLITKHGQILKNHGFYFGVGGETNTSKFGDVTEAGIGVGVLLKVGQKNLYRLHLPLFPYIPTREAWLYLNLFQTRDKLIRAMNNINLDRSYSLSIKFRDLVTRFKGSLRKKWNTEPEKVALNKVDPLNSMANLFHPFYKGPQHIFLRGCARMLSLLTRGI